MPKSPASRKKRPTRPGPETGNTAAGRDGEGRGRAGAGGYQEREYRGGTAGADRRNGAGGKRYGAPKGTGMTKAGRARGGCPGKKAEEDECPGKGGGGKRCRGGQQVIRWPRWGERGAACRRERTWRRREGQRLGVPRKQGMAEKGRGSDSACRGNRAWRRRTAEEDGAEVCRTGADFPGKQTARPQPPNKFGSRRSLYYLCEQ